jgi:hypothetical protein
MPLFKCKAGDTGSPIIVKLKDANKRAEQLGVDDVARFRMVPVIDDLTDPLDAEMTVLDTDPATVQYEWNGLDNAVPGMYRAEVFVQYASGKTRTFPTDGWIDVEIEARATEQPGVDAMDAIGVSVTRAS